MNTEKAKVGRPVGWRKAEPNQRAHRQLRAFDDEWQVIKDFVKLLREHGVDETKKKLDAIK